MNVGVKNDLKRQKSNFKGDTYFSLLKKNSKFPAFFFVRIYRAFWAKILELQRKKKFDEAKKQFRLAARDENKRIKKTANSWIKYAENEAIRVQNLNLRREFIEKSNAESKKS